MTDPSKGLAWAGRVKAPKLMERARTLARQRCRVFRARAFGEEAVVFTIKSSCPIQQTGASI
jgi:hypothetical protein